MEPTTSVTTASIIEIVLAAPLVVQLVMALLVGLSLWSWSLIVSKSLLLWQANQNAQAFEESFWRSRYLSELHDSDEPFTAGPLFQVFSTGMTEWRNAPQTTIERSTLSLIQRIDRVMQTEISRQMDTLERQMIILASIGTAAPFIGLFGTVWGVMNAFLGIAAAGDTTLAVVAPGIAEALLATALGLVAAIPASIAYNKFSTDLARFANRMEDFASLFSSLLNRELEAKG